MRCLFTVQRTVKCDDRRHANSCRTATSKPASASQAHPGPALALGVTEEVLAVAVAAEVVVGSMLVVEVASPRGVVVAGADVARLEAVAAAQLPVCLERLLIRRNDDITIAAIDDHFVTVADIGGCDMHADDGRDSQ